MAVVIKNDASDILLQDEMPFDVTKLSSPTILEDVKNLSFDFGNATFNSLYFDGYHLGHGTAQIYENLHISHSKGPGQLVDMLFLQRGRFNTGLEGVTDNLRFSTLEHNLLYTPTGDETASVEKQDGLNMFMISFTAERFLSLAEHNGDILGKMADEVAGNRAAILEKDQNPHITPRMNAIIEEITNCNFQGGLKKLFLQSKTLELLALQCSQVIEGMSHKSNKPLSASDRERLDYARSVLLANMQQPPTLAQLARMAGINEFKLKNGFKQLYNTTVFGYLSDYRLELAKDMILDGAKSLTDIADEAGYSSLPHFSTAFRKKFGVSPSRIKH
ncbi:transcriptional regulator, AraC family [Chitinophaga jiangningensis]|uniref:Transcriptional regulator, AraC family n=1 Tax=Chitinophaga jiangningensis TaxID=1419482 RepID=A0A1M6YJR7_9BACT|nr:AraC family transcriptional regulator [Chitinophaga jiangningensis]SHL18360.1 transcriptional regulator, AraC family [Chitinophaga jiangningensis]